MHYWDDYGRTWKWEPQEAPKASRGDRTRCSALYSAHLEGREIPHYDKQALEEQPFGPSTSCSEWNRSDNRFFPEVEANRADEVANADGRPVPLPEGTLELAIYTLDGVVIGLGKQEIAEQVQSEGSE